MFVERKFTGSLPKQRRAIFGVGINDADYPISYTDPSGKKLTCPYYRTWASMLERCFSPNFHKKRPTYKGCTLEKSWKLFSNFKLWMQSQDWEGKELDKDILNWDNKHYGPETCLFISHALNNLLTTRTRYRGEFPLGVSKMVCKGITYYVASCSFYGKQKRLGYFKTVAEAAEAYKKAKLTYIAELAKAESNPKVRQALVNIW